MENCLIDNTKRSRVHGSGPNRKQLKHFSLLDRLEQSDVDSLLKLALASDRNDLGTDTYEISKHCNFEEVFNAAQNYRQILLQHKQNSLYPINEYNYTDWDDSVPRQVIEKLRQMFGEIYRFRISVMEADHELNWHIDTDTSIICRAQICLNDNESSFDFDAKGVMSSYSGKPGDIHFINTGWKHRVVNGDKQRIVAIFAFRFEDASEEVKELIHV